LGIPCLDVTPAFLQYEEPTRLYIEHDGHLSVQGAQVTADALASFLVSGPFQAWGHALGAPQN
jgi:hypothetical protein